MGGRQAIVAIVLVLAGQRQAWAQPGTSSPRMITVDGRNMRLWSAGVDQRKPGSPVVILEAGLGSTLEAWRPVFNDIARLAPVVAYDRGGLGQSDFDNVPPTFTHVAETLHELLHAADIQGPYVLVAHSWGVAFVRTFIDRYPLEAAGAVFLEATDFERTPTETVAELPPGTQVLDNAPGLPDGPPGFRAEVEQLLAEGERGFATFAPRACRYPCQSPLSLVVPCGLIFRPRQPSSSGPSNASK